MTALTTHIIDGHEFYLPAEPAPIVHDEPPADIDACEHCDGLGVRVTGFDEAERPLDETCTWCDGSGNRRGSAGAA